MMAFNYSKPFCRKNRFLYLHCKKLPIVAKKIKYVMEIKRDREEKAKKVSLYSCISHNSFSSIISSMLY